MDDIVNDSDIVALCRKDALFEAILRRWGPPPSWKREQGFVSLCRIILEQQVSLASANAHFKKLDTFLPAFTPMEILKLSDDEMRACQISRQKARYLRALAEAITTEAIRFEALESLTDRDISDRLTTVKGIGNWTADVYLMFCLQRKDIFPIGDVALLNAVKELAGVTTKDAVLKLSQNWQPLRSLAAYFFWHHYLAKKSH